MIGSVAGLRGGGGPLRVVRTAAGEPLADAARTTALLRRAADDPGAGAVLRLTTARPTIGFSRRDTLLSGFPAAVQAAGRHGYASVVRGPGGRAAAYHHGCLLLDHVSPDPQPHPALGRFEEVTHLLAAALRSLGVDARVGPVPGEYCPGEFSVNAAGRVKLVGTAQRVVRGAWHLGAVILVRDPEPVRTVLDEVYPALGLEWDPATVGAVEQGTGAGVDDVRDAVLEAYRGVLDLTDGAWPEGVEPDESMLDRHRPQRHGEGTTSS